MKLAFVHCRIMKWWALNVFQELIMEEIKKLKNWKIKKLDAERWKLPTGQAGVRTLGENEKINQFKIFTLISDRKFLEIENLSACNNGYEKIEIVTALPNWINQIFLFFAKKNFPILSWIFDYRNLMFFYPRLMKILSKKIKKFWAEKIVISSFAIGKNISIEWSVYKTLYLHSPMQYIRSHYDEYIWKLKWLKLFLFKFISNRLRKRDKKFVKFDEIYANSNYTAKLAKEIYWLDCKVRYPKISEIIYNESNEITWEYSDYYIYIWRLVSFVKEVDKVIRLFNELKRPLIIMWSWPDELYLKSIAGNNIIFVWWIDYEKKKDNFKILKNAKGFINLTKESFGIATVEALILWVPVFGYNKWWSVELVDKDSWILVENKDQLSLIQGFEKFEKINWNRKKISEVIKNKIK